MRKILLSLAIAFAAFSGFAAEEKVEPKFYDISEVSIVNRAQPGGNPLMRLDVDKYPQLSDKAAKYLSFPTGVAIRFNTNSDFIEAVWQTGDKERHANIVPVAARGLDLYIKKDGKWLFAGIGKPSYTGTQNSGTVIANMDNSMKECLLYLPTFEKLTSFQLGLNPTAKVEFLNGFQRAPIVAVGSSFTHGVSASRPGMAWPAQLSRRLGVDIANLGTSGIQKMEPFYADVIADTDADMFIFDCFSNPTGKEIRERIAPFVEIIRKKHPNTPLVFLQTFNRERNNFDLKSRKVEAEKWTAAEEELAKLMANDKNIYFINPGLWAGDDHESSADGTHPSDMGYQRAVDNMEPHIRAIMDKYGIKAGLTAKQARWEGPVGRPEWKKGKNKSKKK